jgi:hypothetical protein
LHQVVLHLHLGQSLPPLDQLVQRVVRANFQEDVHILVVLKHVLELNDMVVVERFVDLDFSDKLNYGKSYLLLSPGTVQRALWNDLGGKDLFSFEIGNFVALGKPTAAQRLAPGILLDHDLAICLGHFLLNDDCITTVLILHVRLSLHYILKIILLINFNQDYSLITIQFPFIFIQIFASLVMGYLLAMVLVA